MRHTIPQYSLRFRDHGIRMYTEKSSSSLEQRIEIQAELNSLANHAGVVVSLAESCPQIVAGRRPGVITNYQTIAALESTAIRRIIRNWLAIHRVSHPNLSDRFASALIRFFD